MSQTSMNELKPFISILFIIITLFSMVFLKMEVRNQGYTVWKKARAYKKMRDSHRLKVIEYARLKSPAQLSQKLQSKMTNINTDQVQVIQISGDYVAVKQGVYEIQ